MVRRPILSLAFALVLLVPFVGCGGSSSPTEPMPVASQPTATAAPAATAAVAEPIAGEDAGARAPHAVGAGARARVDEGAALEARGTKPSPVEPARPEAPFAAEPATAGNGHGHGGGNGGGHGGGHGGGPHSGDLTLALQPDVWNTNWEHSQGTVSALIRGQDVTKIDPSSIKLVGDATGGTPVSPLRVQKQGPQLRAFFAMAEALAALDTPAPGETHVVTIDYSTTGGGAVAHLTDTVRIVGPGGPGGGGTGELILVMQPDHWNTNWRHSAGTVSALIRGAGLADIDLATIFLVGTDPAAAPLAALRASREGNHVRAFFAQSAAFATLLAPEPGKTYTITIKFDKAGTSTTLTDTIEVVGPAL